MVKEAWALYRMTFRNFCILHISSWSSFSFPETENPHATFNFAAHNEVSHETIGM